MKEITRARSKKNGIVFYSNTIPQLAVDAFVDEKGKVQAIVTFHIITDIVDFFFGDEQMKPIIPFIRRKYVVLLQIILFVLLTVLFRNAYLSIALFYTFLFAPDWFELVYSAYKLKFGSCKDIARFHAAEHMAINAYCKLQKVPTVEEIKGSSRFSSYCGSMIILNKAIPSLLCTLCLISGIFVNFVMYMCLATFTLLFSLVLCRFKLLKYFQIFFTAKPTDIELEVALKGIQAYDDMEKHISARWNQSCYSK